MTGYPWSHSGILAKSPTGTLVVVDNYPQADPNSSSIQTHTLEEFFSHGPGGVWRYVGVGLTDPQALAIATKASQWALAQVGNPAYSFNLLDPYTNNNTVQYCSEFVWRAFEFGGDDLVPVPLSLKGANEASTRQALIDYAESQNKFAPKKVIETEVDKLITRHDGKFVAPGQLDDGNPKTKRISK